MNRPVYKKKLIVNASGLILIILICYGIFSFNRNFNFEKLRSIHIAMEKELGEKELNRLLYSYDSLFPIDKFIFTDYKYLRLLPTFNKYYSDGEVQKLQPSDTVFSKESVGYLLMTPVSSKPELPDFIEKQIASGVYKDIFNINGYRFIKIR